MLTGLPECVQEETGVRRFWAIDESKRSQPWCKEEEEFEEDEEADDDDPDDDYDDEEFEDEEEFDDDEDLDDEDDDF